MSQSPFLYALKYLSQNCSEISIYDIASAIIAETIFVQRANAQETLPIVQTAQKNANNIDSDILGNYKKQVNQLAKFKRESLYRYIRYNTPDVWLKDVWEKTRKPWCYESINEVTVSLQPFIKKLKAYEIKENKPYPIGDEIVCGKEIWPKEYESKQNITHNGYDLPQTTEDNLDNLKNEICKLYDELVEKRGGVDTVKEYEYIWQWLISTLEYEKIKEVLTSDKCKNSISKLYKKNNKVLFLIVAYVAERYKREYNGEDGEDNAILQIGLSSEDCKYIATNYFKDNLEKIKKHNNSKNKKRSVTEWLESLRMEGGLPIKSIVNGNNQLENFTAKLYEDTYGAIAFLTEKLNNKTIKYSYENKYSMYEYIQALIGRTGVYCKEDAELDLFQDFQKKLEEGRGNALRNSRKFGIDYSVWRWHYPEEFVIHRCVCLRAASNLKEEQDIISKERIEKLWKVYNPTYVFWLRISSKDYEKYYEFCQRSNGYRSATGRVDFPLPDVDLSESELPEVKITYIPQDKNGQKDKDESHWTDISKDIVKEKKGYIIFSSKDGNRWFDGQNSNSGIKGAVLVVGKGVNVDESGIFDKKEPEDGMRWFEFGTNIKINGKLHSVGYSEIQPKAEALHHIYNLKYVHKNIRLLRLRKDQDKTEESIWLLKQSGAKKENFLKITDKGLVNIWEIKYHDSAQKKWVKLNKNSKLPLGFTRLRFDDSKKEFNVFVLPDNATIERELGRERGKIITRNIDNIEGLVRTTNIYQREFHYENIVDKSNTTHEVFIKIDDSQHIAMDIVYPWEREDRILGKKIIDQKVPRKLAAKHRLRIFDEEGVNFIEDRDSLIDYNGEIRKEYNRYLVGTEDGLEFVFMTTDGTEYPVEIKREEERERVRCYLDIPEGVTSGIIFQSLKNKQPELVYYKPRFHECEIDDFRNISATALLKCEEHKLYYNVLLSKEMITPKLFFEYCDHCINNERGIGYNHLWDLAKEFGIDWILNYPRTEWEKAMNNIDCDRKKEWVTGLFCRHPQFDNKSLSNFVKGYWLWKWKRTIPQATANDHRRFLFYAIKGKMEILERNGKPVLACEVRRGVHTAIDWDIPAEMPDFTGKDIDRIICKN